MSLLQCLLLLLFLHQTLAVKYTCVFSEMYGNSEHYWNVNAKPDQTINPPTSGRTLITLNRPAMRITLETTDFDTMKTDGSGNDVTTTTNLNFIKKAMQVTESFFEARLQVTSVGTVYPPDPCFDYSPSATDVANGFAATDLLIYVLYIGDSSISYGATGVSCKWVTGQSTPDTTLQQGRPTVGRIIFNTYNLVDQQSSLTNRLFAEVTATAIHETMHILGFDQSLYSTYLNPDDGLVYSSTTVQVELHASRTGGNNHLLTTPFVTAWAQDFFNCSNITGMALQNEEGTSNPGSHWERLSMYDQIMTGTQLGAQKAFSGLTFALLKDMGWYGVDDSFNDTVNYGYKRGCQFYTGACYAATTEQKYFCNPNAYSGVSACSTSFLGKAVCSDESAIMADGCGIFGEYFHCVDSDSTDDGYQAYTLEQYGQGSFCVKSTLSTVGVASQYRSRCYPYVCDASTNKIEFTVGAYTVHCLSSEEGLQKTVSALDGYLQCPIYTDFCTQSRKLCSNWCSQNGFCTRGVCNCMQGYYGSDCSISVCSSGEYYDHDASACVSNCPSGTYENTLSKTCLACDSACSQCRDQSTICTSCVSTPQNPQYYYDTDNQCVSECPSHTYQSGDDCFDCDTGANCATCDQAASNCTSCLNGLFLSTPTHGTCGATCTAPYSLKDQVNNQCVQTCPIRLYKDNNDCIYCPTGYKIPTDNICTNECGSGYFEDDSIKFCSDCDSDCEECDGIYAENCTKCSSIGTLNYLYLKMCVNTCPNGYYANDTSGVCEICTIGLFCATCQVDNSGDVQCKTCSDGYYLQADQTCATGCNQYFFKNEWNHSCDACHSDCGDCTSSYASSCLNCRNGSYFLQNTTGGYCLSSCPTEAYVTYVDECYPCHETCLTCNGITSADCHSCVEGLYLEGSRCRYVCSPGMYPDKQTNICESCDAKCSFCFGPTVDNCTECTGSYVLSNFTCTTSCPTGYRINVEYQVCEFISSKFFN